MQQPPPKNKYDQPLVISPPRQYTVNPNPVLVPNFKKPYRLQLPEVKKDEEEDWNAEKRLAFLSTDAPWTDIEKEHAKKKLKFL